jgi:TonB family protein
VTYPFAALEKGIEGQVLVHARVDADGTVSASTVVECPRELCDAAVDSLPQWQFDRRDANTTRAIRIDFVRPAGTSAYGRTADPEGDEIEANLGMARALIVLQKKPPVLLAQAMGSSGGFGRGGVPRGVTGNAASTVGPALPALPSLPTFTTRTVWLDGAYVTLASPESPRVLGQKLRDVQIAGLSDTETAQLWSRIPVHSGDVWSAAAAGIVSQVVAGFNRKLEVDVVDHMQSGGFSLWIGPVSSPVVSGGKRALIEIPPVPAGTYTAGNGVTPPAVLTKFDPVYTDGALSAGTSGDVLLSVVVGANGLPEDIQVIGSLDPGLDQSAVQAVTKWRFRPGSKDGSPVGVQALVDLSFRVL